MFKKPLFLLYIMFSFLGIDLFVFEAKARSQNLHSLSNSELSDFVSTYESDIQGQIHSCFWAIPNSRTRLGVRLLPRCILDEERSGNGIAFDRWCAEQMPAIPGERQSSTIYNARECYRGAMNF